MKTIKNHHPIVEADATIPIFIRDPEKKPVNDIKKTLDVGCFDCNHVANNLNAGSFYFTITYSVNHWNNYDRVFEVQPLVSYVYLKWSEHNERVYNGNLRVNYLLSSQHRADFFAEAYEGIEDLEHVIKINHDDRRPVVRHGRGIDPTFARLKQIEGNDDFGCVYRCPLHTLTYDSVACVISGMYLSPSLTHGVSRLNEWSLQDLYDNVKTTRSRAVRLRTLSQSRFVANVGLIAHQRDSFEVSNDDNNFNDRRATEVFTSKKPPSNTVVAGNAPTDDVRTFAVNRPRWADAYTIVDNAHTQNIITTT